MAKKIQCTCANCREIFDFNNARIVERLLYNIPIKEKVCPNCGSKGFTKIKDIKWFDKYLIQTEIN